MTTTHSSPEHSELGKISGYDPVYNPDKLFAIARQSKRDEINVPSPLPFFGFDLWNHYEISWLNPKGKPVVATAHIRYSCDTPFIIESKSMKLYFNSFNNTSFVDSEEVRATAIRDLSERVGGDVFITFSMLTDPCDLRVITRFPGQCIDTLDVECTVFTPDPTLLATTEEYTDKTLYSDLLKSNCLVTGQPDWGSILIAYRGKKIIPESLLRYLVSFRNHNEFHEQCIERIFMDISQQCQPDQLTIYGRYTRRGGLDINPFRSTEKNISDIENSRLIRQ